jgi:hypothetical protein
MDWSSFGAGFGTSLLGLLIGLFLNHRLTVGREELAEKRLQLQKQRDASVAVVGILSQWVRSTYLGRPLTDEEIWQLQTTYWENILLLDRELINLLFPRLANLKDAVTTNELIVQVRKYLLQLEEPDIRASDLNNWPPRAGAER